MADIFELFKKISKTESATGPVEYVVAGLGNPGDKYAHTRHNVGFGAIEYLCEKYGARTNKSSHKGLWGEAAIAGKRVLLVKPQTFMNNSGECIKGLLDYYKIPPERLIVIFDDISLDVGRLRVRRNGSAGGHNGIKSIIEHLGTNDFPRIKIGVGQKPHPDYDLADWVLSDFPKADLEAFPAIFETSREGLEQMLLGNIEEAMQICNRKG